MIHFVVALRAEAAPLIERYGMERMEHGFRSEHECLVVTGVGKKAAAAATAALHERIGALPNGTWLNVGIAGHRDRSPGELILASRVHDAVTGEVFDPPLPDVPSLERARVTTVDAPETRFPTPDVYDMEASGVFGVARHFAVPRQVQCLKVVSDNRETGTIELTRAKVTELIARHLESIDAFVAHLREPGR